MIKILEAKPVPRATVECNNCGSLLEYGNADLMEMTVDAYNINIYHQLLNYHFNCPVCGCIVIAEWVYNKEKSESLK